MITIENSQILKDGEFLGTISGDVAYMLERPAPRTIGQIRVAANNPLLAIALGEPDVPIEAPSVPPKPVLPEPSMHPHMGDKDPNWQRWFIATHGEQAFRDRWPARQLPTL